MQGLLEWLPVSSKSMIILYLANAAALKGETAYSIAIFLHFSTATSALLMFRSEYWAVTKSLTSWSEVRCGEGAVLLRNLVVTSVVSILFGAPLYFLARQYILEAGGLILNSSVGLLLVTTGLLLGLSNRSGGQKTIKNVGLKDSVLAGVTQGLSAVPGLSRSGLVASALLLRGLDKEAALRLTFIISVPVIYGVALADLAFGFGFFRSSVNEVGLENMLAASIVGFVVSLCCLRALLKMAARLNFSRFLLGFGGLTLGLTVLSALLR